MTELLAFMLRSSFFLLHESRFEDFLKRRMGVEEILILKWKIFGNNLVRCYTEKTF